MLRILFLMFYFIVFFDVNLILAQHQKNEKIPEAVLNEFRRRYPDTYVYHWEWKKKKMVYEAEFIKDGKRYEAHFTQSGEWVKTEREIKKSEIPEAVWKSFRTSPYAHWKIVDQEEHSTPNYELLYEIKVKNFKRKVFLYFLPDGTQVQADKSESTLDN